MRPLIGRSAWLSAIPKPPSIQIAVGRLLSGEVAVVRDVEEGSFQIGAQL